MNATARVGGIAVTGTLDATASVLGIPVPISGDVTGTVNNLDVNVAIKQSLDGNVERLAIFKSLPCEMKKGNHIKDC